MHLDVNHRTVTFEIDTGSGLTIVSRDAYERLFSKYRMETCKLNVLRQLHVNVTHENKQFSHLKTVVLKGSGVNLLGGEWLNQIRLNWNNLIRCSSHINDDQQDDGLQSCRAKT